MECFLGLAVGRHWLGHGFFSSSYWNWWSCVQVSWCYFCAPVMAFLWDFVGKSAQHYNLNRYMKSRAHSGRDYSHTHGEKTSAKNVHFLQVYFFCILICTPCSCYLAVFCILIRTFCRCYLAGWSQLRIAALRPPSWSSARPAPRFSDFQFGPKIFLGPPGPLSDMRLYLSPKCTSY